MLKMQQSKVVSVANLNKTLYEKTLPLSLLVHLHGQLFVVSLPYADNKWFGSECDLLSQHIE